MLIRLCTEDGGIEWALIELQGVLECDTLKNDLELGALSVNKVRAAGSTGCFRSFQITDNDPLSAVFLMRCCLLFKYAHGYI